MLSKQPRWWMLPVATFLLAAGMAILRLVATVAPAVSDTNEQPVTDASPVGSLAASASLTNTGEQAQAQEVVPGPTAPAAPLPPTAAVPPLGRLFVQAVSGDVDLLNPLLTTNKTTQAVADLILPALVGQDNQTGLAVPTALAEHWVADASGHIYTFTLRSDVVWSDGLPVTAQDVQFTYAALVDAATATPYRDSLAEIATLSARGDRIVVVTFRTTSCANLHQLRHPILPSHLFAVDFSDLRTNPFNSAPVVGAGPFLFAEHVPAERIRLVRNPGFWDNSAEIEAWELRVIADPAEQTRLLLAGDVDLAAIPSTWLGQVESASQLTVVSAANDGYDFLAMNLADPLNPLPGQDAAGVLTTQPPHPILGDLRVRNAIAQGLDLEQLRRPIDDLSSTFSLPGYLWMTASWAFDPEAPAPTFAPDQAMQLLADAGWVDGDGDGLRERDGRPLRLTLITNDDSPARMAIGRLVSEQLRSLGIVAQFAPAPFEEVTAQLLNQQFDLAIAGWDNLGPDPASAAFWHSRDDAPGAGLNFVSFQDAEVDAWLDEAAHAPGCTPAGRAMHYQRVQQRVQEQRPYVIIGGRLTHWGYHNRWQHVEPGPWGWIYDVQAWRRAAG